MKKLPQTQEMRVHMARLRASKNLHPDERRFLMEHGAEFPLQRRVRCSFCGELAARETAHRHQGKYICDSFCWELHLKGMG